MPARPLCGCPSSQPVAPSKFIVQVALPWMPIFFSREPQLTPLRSPRPPSAFGTNFGPRNSELRLTPGRRVGQPGQHEVDDVLGQVMLAARDEDLGAVEPVAA